jgi:hypothetical protein
MKIRPSLPRVFAFVILSAACTSFVPAAPAPETRLDPAAQTLARHGAVPVLRAGPFVAPGTFRVQVSTKFGRPDVVLADGTWLYHDRRIEGSDTDGTLVIRFERNRVSSLTLVTPAVATALRNPSPEKAGTGIVASN